MSGRIPTIYRSTLAECTVDWRQRGTNPVDAYIDFLERLGKDAGNYEDYISTAITAGGYKRDATIPYADVVAKNSDYAFAMADELHRQGQLNVHETLDAVALGKTGWRQRDYLLFFFNAMARPIVRSKESPEYNLLQSIFTTPEQYDAEVFNNESLPNEERYPHYSAFAYEYWQRISALDIAPIDRTVRVLDWDRTLGGRAEEELAKHIGIRVATPHLIQTSCDFSALSVSDELRTHMQQLTNLGADILAPPATPRLVLVDE